MMSSQQLINRKQHNVGDIVKCIQYGTMNKYGTSAPHIDVYESHGNDENPELQGADGSHGNDQEPCKADAVEPPKTSRLFSAVINFGKRLTSVFSKKDPRPITRYQRHRQHPRQRQHSVDDRLLYNVKINAQANDEEPKSAPLKKSPSLRELGISAPTMISCTLPGVMSLPDLRATAPSMESLCDPKCAYVLRTAGFKFAEPEH